MTAESARKHGHHWVFRRVNHQKHSSGCPKRKKGSSTTRASTASGTILPFHALPTPDHALPTPDHAVPTPDHAQSLVNNPELHSNSPTSLEAVGSEADLPHENVQALGTPLSRYVPACASGCEHA